MRNPIRIATLTALALFAALTPDATAQSDAAFKDLGEAITNKVVPGLGSKIFSDHSKVRPFQIDGRWVYALRLVDEGGSRCTLNWDAQWKGRKRFTAYIAGVDPLTRATMHFQRKGDKSGRPDSNRGPAFRHREEIEIDGSRNYLAQRDFKAGDVLKDNPSAVVLLVEDGLTIERVMEYIKK